MKIKKVITVTMSCLIIIALLAIWSKAESRNYYKTLDIMDAHIHELLYEYKASAFAIDTLKYIEDQGQMDNKERVEKLSIFAKDSKMNLIEQTDNNQELLLVLEENLEDLKGIIGRVVSIEEVDAAIENVESEYLLFEEIIEQRINLSNLKVNDLLYQYEILGDSLELMLNNFNAYRYDFRTQLIVVDYVAIVLIFLGLLVLALIIFRLFYKDLPFILNSFKALENHETNTKLVKAFVPIFKEEKEVIKLINTIVDEQRDSTQFKNQVMDTYLMDEIIEKLYNRVNQIFPVERIGIAFVDYSKKKIIAEHGILKTGQIKLGPGYQVPFDKTSLVEILESKKGLINNDLLNEYTNSNKSGALNFIIGEGLKSNMIIPLLSGNGVFGLLFFSSNRKNFFSEDHFRIVNKMAYEISGFLNRAYLTKVILAKITASFAELVDRKDNETGGHILRMVTYSVIIAKALSKMNLEAYPVDKEMILNIERNAATHDIGKVGIPDAILKKPGKLTPDEWQIMKTHAAIGGDIFKNIRKDMSMFDHDFYAVAEDICRSHHEKYDGSGYPEGLKGQDIPLVARIVALADVFDALTSKRVYKRAFSFEEAIEIIHKDKSIHFDPYVVDAFDASIDEIHEIYLKSED